MNVETIWVRGFSVSSGVFTEDGLFHQKSLPVLSVVQALEGAYEFGLTPDGQQRVDAPGAFVAPSGRMQYITHRVHPATGVMRAQWLFLDVLVNQTMRLDDLFDFPSVLPAACAEPVRTLLGEVASAGSLCGQLAALYRLLDVLLPLGQQKEPANAFAQEVRAYVEQHCGEALSDEQLARHLAVSRPTLYRRFQQQFHRTPAHYINDVRLSRAIVLLETTNLPLWAVSEAIGLRDPFYFSRLFRRKYGTSPSLYRRQFGGRPEGD